MERVLVIADNFKLVHYGHMLLFKKIEALMKEYDVSKTIIFIAHEPGDVLGYNEKEAILKKIIAKDNDFNIYEVESLKIFKDIKKINEDGYDVISIFTEPLQLSFIQSSVDGLDVEVRPYKHGYDVLEIESYISNNMYQEYCKVMPQVLWSEFQNLKEIYNMNKLNEEKIMSNKISNKQFEAIISDKIDSYLNTLSKIKSDKQLEEHTISKKDLSIMIEDILNEKLVGKEFDAMHELKASIVRDLNRIANNKWALTIPKITEKPDGSKVINIIGSGNISINLHWGEMLEGDFHFTTGAGLIAGDEYSTKVYSFMLSLVENRDLVVQCLIDVENSYHSIQGVEYDIDDIDDDIDGIINDIDNVNSTETIKSEIPEPIIEPVMDDEV